MSSDVNVHGYMCSCNLEISTPFKKDKKQEPPYTQVEPAYSQVHVCTKKHNMTFCLFNAENLLVYVHQVSEHNS